MLVPVHTECCTTFPFFAGDINVGDRFTLREKYQSSEFKILEVYENSLLAEDIRIRTNQKLFWQEQGESRCIRKIWLYKCFGQRVDYSTTYALTKYFRCNDTFPAAPQRLYLNKNLCVYMLAIIHIFGALVPVTPGMKIYVPNRVTLHIEKVWECENSHMPCTTMVFSEYPSSKFWIDLADTTESCVMLRSTDGQIKLKIVMPIILISRAMIAHTPATQEIHEEAQQHFVKHFDRAVEHMLVFDQFSTFEGRSIARIMWCLQSKTYKKLRSHEMTFKESFECANSLRLMDCLLVCGPDIFFGYLKSEIQSWVLQSSVRTRYCVYHSFRFVSEQEVDMANQPSACTEDDDQHQLPLSSVNYQIMLHGYVFGHVKITWVLWFSNERKKIDMVREYKGHLSNPPPLPVTDGVPVRAHSIRVHLGHGSIDPSSAKTCNVPNFRTKKVLDFLPLSYRAKVESHLRDCQTPVPFDATARVTYEDLRDFKRFLSCKNEGVQKQINQIMHAWSNLHENEKVNLARKEILFYRTSASHKKKLFSDFEKSKADDAGKCFDNYVVSAVGPEFQKAGQYAYLAFANYVRSYFKSDARADVIDCFREFESCYPALFD